MLKSYFQPFGPSMQTEFLPNVISGTGIPSLAANSSQSAEEDIGNLVDVTVHPESDTERVDPVVLSVWGMVDISCGYTGAKSSGTWVFKFGCRLIDRVKT